MDEDEFPLEDFDQVVLECASDEDCMIAYLEKRGATQAQIEAILKLRKIREDRDA